MAEISLVKLSEIAAQQRWDAEAFKPLLRVASSKLSDHPSLHAVATVTHASEIERVYTDSSNGVPFLLAQNIRPVLPALESLSYISKTIAGAIPVNRLQHGDVLVTRSGAFSGNACVFLGDNGAAYTSGEGLILRSLGNISGPYLSVYLSTAIGSALVRRAIYGSGQPHIGPKYLEQIPVYRGGKLEKTVDTMVNEAYKLLRAAETEYPDAQKKLLARMDWEAMSATSQELCYSQRWTQIEESGRLDPEHFQPKFSRLRSHLLQKGSRRIGDICPVVIRGVQPLFAEEGTVIVIDSKAVRQYGVQPGPERTTVEYYNHPTVKKAHVTTGDVLLNCTGRGTLGRAACYQLQSSAICDNHVAILRPHKEICRPSYLALFMNAAPGLAQTEMYQTGSSGQLELYPQHLKEILVFLPTNKIGQIDLAWQDQLSAIVEKAARDRADAEIKVKKAIDLVNAELSKAVYG